MNPRSFEYFVFEIYIDLYSKQDCTNICMRNCKPSQYILEQVFLLLFNLIFNAFFLLQQRKHIQINKYLYILDAVIPVAILQYPFYNHGIE